MKLLLDAGNSRLKWALLDKRIIGPTDALAWADIDRLPGILSTLPDIDAALLCSVAPAAVTERVLQCARSRWSAPLELVQSAAEAAGVRSAYTHPKSLGVDRWVAMIGAHHHYGDDKCIVDLGTAITVDLLTADGTHQGGVIAPGYRAMMTALHAATGLPIPNEPPTVEPLRPHAATAGAIRGGALHALVGLIDTAHRGFHDGSSTVLLAGGDADRVRPHLTMPVANAPGLVFQGLAVLAES